MIGRIKFEPTPSLADGAKIDQAAAKWSLSCVNWSSSTSLWKNWRAPAWASAKERSEAALPLDLFDLHPQAANSALLRVFARSRIAEDSSGAGLHIPVDYGGTMVLRIDTDQAVLITAEINLAFLALLALLLASRADAGRPQCYGLVAATDGGRSDEILGTIAQIVRGERAIASPPSASCGVYYGLGPDGAACPVTEGLALPWGHDNNIGELLGLILALRRHVALLLGIGVLEVVRRLQHDCEYGTRDGPVDLLSGGEAADDEVYGARDDGSRDLLVLIDSQCIFTLFNEAWTSGDLVWLRGRTYGLRMEEAIWLRRWIASLGGLVDLVRLSSHVGFIPNVYGDAAATAAKQLPCAGEPPLICRRGLAHLSWIGGNGRYILSPMAAYQSAGELDKRYSKTIRLHVARSETRALVKVKAKEHSVKQGDAAAEIAALRPNRANAAILQRLTNARRDLNEHCDGPSVAELIDDRKYVIPVYDYSTIGDNIGRGHQRYDQRVQHALGKQRGGGIGSAVELTRCGMRQTFRNFDQYASVLLQPRGSNVSAATAVEGETLELVTCTACNCKVHCDAFHFFECAAGISTAALEAVCVLLEKHSEFLNVPSNQSEPGSGDLILELAWTRAVLLSTRQPGERGRYRRFLAAKVLSGSPAPPSSDMISDTTDTWIANDYDRNVEAANDSDVSDDGGDCDRQRRRQVKSKLLARYTHMACKINTLIIDHIKAEYSTWLLRIASGVEQNRVQFGMDFQSVALIEDATITEEQAIGMFHPANGGVERRMSTSEFLERQTAGGLEDGRFVRLIAGEPISIEHRGADSAEARIKRRNAAQQEQVEQSLAAKFKYERLEHEREVSVVLERRIARGFINLGCADEEEAALLLDGGIARAKQLMTEASLVGQRAWHSDESESGSGSGSGSGLVPAARFNGDDDTMMHDANDDADVEGHVDDGSDDDNPCGERGADDIALDAAIESERWLRLGEVWSAMAAIVDDMIMHRNLLSTRRLQQRLKSEHGFVLKVHYDREWLREQAQTTHDANAHLDAVLSAAPRPGICI